MSKSPATYLMEYLISEDINFVSGQNTFLGNSPNDKNDKPYVVFYDSGDIATNPKFKRDEVLVQLIVYSLDFSTQDNAYVVGYNFIKCISDLLLGTCPTSNSDGSAIQSITLSSGIAHLGLDDRNRHRFSMTFKVIIDNIPGGSRTSL